MKNYLMVTLLLAGACSSGGLPSSDGGSGGDDGGVAMAAQCGMAACGGNLVGTWKPVSWCGKSVMVLPCTSTLNEAHIKETGALTFASDLTYTYSLQLNGMEEFTLANSCQSVMGTGCDQRCKYVSPISTGTPTPDMSGCVCAAALSRSDAWGDVYSTTGSGGLIFDKDHPSQAQYCVQGNMLVITGLDERSTTGVFVRQ